MSSEAQSAQTWIEHLDIISSVLSEVEPADLDSAFNLGSAFGYLGAVRNLFYDLVNSES